MEQLERTERYLKRLRTAYAGMLTDWGNRSEYDDDVHTFFIHCYHVRDWIIHLNKVGLTASEVDKFIESKVCLRICADLANGVKHCKLTRGTRSGEKPHVSGRRYESSMWFVNGGGGEVIKAKYTVSTATGIIDALELAEQCFSAWQELINDLRFLAKKM